MEKIFDAMKMKIEDETAAFAILGAMILTFAITIGVFDYISSIRVAEVSTNISVAQMAETFDKIGRL